MVSYRFKHSFTAGELSPLMEGRVDFDRYKNGCKRLYNMIALVQGPAARRPGLKFVHNISSLFPAGEIILRTRQIPFIRSSISAINLVFIETINYSRIYFFNKHQIVTMSGAPYFIDLPEHNNSRWDITNFDYAQSIDEMYFSQRSHPPYQLVLAGGLFNLDPIAFVETPKDPLSNEYWGDGNGWPERVTFHQQRLFFAANILYRDHFWASAAGEFFNFGKHSSNTDSDIVEADGFSFSLVSGQYNAIQWIMSGKSLQVGTVGDEWTITGANQTAITALSKLALPQTNVGSEPFRPLMVNNALVFISRGGKEVNEFIYDFNMDSYKTSELSVLSPHITEVYPFTDWCFQKQPFSVIWLVRADGGLIGLTVNRPHKVVGWHSHATLGRCMSIASMPGETREDDVWLIVERGPEGAKQVFIEVMDDMFVGGHARDSRFMDSFQEYRITVPNSPKIVIPPVLFPILPTPGNEETDDLPDQTVGTPIPENVMDFPTDYPQPIPVSVDSDWWVVFDGLDHLNNMRVSILIDGAVYPEQVVSNGNIKVQLPPGVYSSEEIKAVVGLNFISEVRPYVPDFKTNEGTTLGRMQRITKLDIDFYRTLGAFIGKIDTETNEIIEEELPFRKPTDTTGIGVPLYTGIYHWDFVEGFSRKSDYFIKQKQPLPMIIRGITDTSEVYE